MNPKTPKEILDECIKVKPSDHHSLTTEGRIIQAMQLFADQEVKKIDSLVDELTDDYRKFETEGSQINEYSYVKGKAEGKSLAYADAVYRMRNILPNI